MGEKGNLARLFRREGWVIGLLALFAVLQGFYAVQLNHLFYTKNGPFYDSLAYNDNLAHVLTVAKAEGIRKGVKAAVESATVALPFMMAAIVSPVAPISRATGVWLQVPWVFALLVSVYALFRVRLQASRGLAAALALPPASIAGIYNWNGGLSDFRMDLHLYLFFGCAVCWFILAIYRSNYWFWAICGAFCGLAALARATSPIYLGAVFAPVLVVHFVLGTGGRTRLMLGAIIAALVAAAESVWFFVYRFKDLYFYYFVWNSDANAHLPLSVSMQHFGFAAAAVGEPVFWGCVAALMLSINWDELRWRGGLETLRSWPWEVAFAALMPAGFLALRGAGLNPFVSMPTAFGIVVLLLGIRGTWANIRGARQVVVILALLAGCLGSACQGWTAHSALGNNRMGGYKKALAMMKGDARQRGLREIRFTVTSLGHFCNEALLNVALFDTRGKLVDGRKAATSQPFQTPNGQWFSCATYIEWQMVPGTRDADKIDTLVRQADTGLDYLLMPTDDTLAELEQHAAHNYINNYARWLKQRLLQDLGLKPISEEIQIGPRESYVIYAKPPR
jgi:hypothetical protein